MSRRLFSVSSFPFSSSPALATSKPQLSKASASTVNVQLPPTTFPWSAFEEEPRVSPTKSRYIPRQDGAYENWTAEMDDRLVQLMTSSPEGYLEQFERIRNMNGDLFANKTARDLRMRWNTFLKPQRYSRDYNVREIKQQLSTRRHQISKNKAATESTTTTRADTKYLNNYFDLENVQVVRGRWCHIPQGKPAPLPGDSKLQYSTDYQRQYQVGLSSLELQVQLLREKEEQRQYEFNSDLSERKEKRQMKRDGQLLMEEVEWMQEEDLVLREAFEAFGDDWDRISRALRVRKRTPAECRERFDQSLLRQNIISTTDTTAVSASDTA